MVRHLWATGDCLLLYTVMFELSSSGAIIYTANRRTSPDYSTGGDDYFDGPLCGPFSLHWPEVVRGGRVENLNAEGGALRISTE